MSIVVEGERSPEVDKLYQIRNLEEKVKGLADDNKLFQEALALLREENLTLKKDTTINFNLLKKVLEDVLGKEQNKKSKFESGIELFSNDGR